MKLISQLPDKYYSILYYLFNLISSSFSLFFSIIFYIQYSLPNLNYDYPYSIFPARPQPRPSTTSIPDHISITTIHTQYSPPDLNRNQSCPIFLAGPHSRSFLPNISSRTPTTTIHI